MKNNNRGFTLVEMLAVVVILAVLISIAIPSYNSYINHTRSKAYETAEETMIKSINTIMLECVTDRTSTFCKDKKFPSEVDGIVKIPLKVLIDEDYMERVKDPKHSNKYCDEEESYAYVKKEKNDKTNGYTYHACLKCYNYASTECE